MAKEEIIEMMNQALKMEHQAFVQYLSHAELVNGNNAEAIISRLKEIAEDEKEHQDMFREMIGSYLGGVPSKEMKEAKDAETTEEILKVNLEDEKEAVEFYEKILEKINEEKDNLPYQFWMLEHEMRHVIIDEQEHTEELRTLLGR